MNKAVKLLLASTAALSLATSLQAEAVSAETVDTVEETTPAPAAESQAAEDVTGTAQETRAVTAQVQDTAEVPAVHGLAADKKVANANPEANNDDDDKEEEYRVATGRVSGDNRYSNSAALSKYTYVTTPTVYIANGYKPTDSLAGAPLAANDKGTILLTRENQLDRSVKDEIQRLKAQNVVILGGEHSVSSDVVKELQGMNLKVSRIAGADRYEQAANVARKMIELNEGYPTEAFLASGDAIPDALSISGIAAQKKIPIFLTRKDKLNDNVVPFLEHIKKWTVLGGTNSISNSVIEALKAGGATTVERIGGKDRYEVNRNILNKYGFMSPGKKKVLVANGDAYSDALPAAIPSFVHDRDIILVSNSDRFLIDQVKFLRNKGVKDAVLVGGLNTLTDLTHSRISDPDAYIRYTGRMNGLSDLVKTANKKHDMTLRQYFPYVSGRNLEYYGIGNKGNGVGDFIFRTKKLVDGQEVSIGTNKDNQYHLYAIYAGMYDKLPHQEIILIFTTLDGKPVLFSSKEMFGRDNANGRTLELSTTDFHNERKAYEELWKETM